MKNITILLFVFSLCGCSQNPIADFSYEIEDDGEVTFLNSSENAKSFQWEFGDGSFDVSKNPKHKFGKNGRFDVRLTATNSKGSHSSIVSIDIDNVAAAEYLIWTKSSKFLPIEIYVDGVLKTNIRKAFKENPGCWTLGAATVVMSPGPHKFRAEGANGSSWDNIDLEFEKGVCKSLELY